MQFQKTPVATPVQPCYRFPSKRMRQAALVSSCSLSEVSLAHTNMKHLCCMYLLQSQKARNNSTLIAISQKLPFLPYKASRACLAANAELWKWCVQNFEIGSGSLNPNIARI